MQETAADRAIPGQRCVNCRSSAIANPKSKIRVNYIFTFSPYVKKNAVSPLQKPISKTFPMKMRLVVTVQFTIEPFQDGGT